MSASWTQNLIEKYNHIIKLLMCVCVVITARIVHFIHIAKHFFVGMLNSIFFIIDVLRTNID